jgi:hypothetical protein
VNVLLEECPDHFRSVQKAFERGLQNTVVLGTAHIFRTILTALSLISDALS